MNASRLSVALALAALGVVGYAAATSLADDAGLRSPRASAPAFALTALDGTPVSLEAMHGKVLLLDFWAT